MKKPFLAVVAIAACTTLVCGGNAGEEMEEASGAETGSGSEAAPPPVDPATAATVTGKAVLEGTPPEQKPIQMGADPVCAKLHDTPVKTQFVVANEDGTVRNVFVYVKQGLEGRKFSSPGDPVLLDQKGCRYHPHVFGIMVGQDLEILNSDDTLHNIHAMPEKNDPFNIGQPVKGLKTTKSFTVPEVMVPFKCDVHKWMNSYAGVLDHPYFAVTGDGGAFDIGDLPPGDYVIEAWHESMGTQSENVTLGESETKEITFTFTPTE